MIRRLLPALAIIAVLTGCGNSPYAGTWTGKLVPDKKFKSKAIGYSDSKPTFDNTLVLDGSGTYTAKFREVDYGGAWEASGSKLTLTPDTFMGMKKDQITSPKGNSTATAVNKMFDPVIFDVSADGKTLTLTQPAGVTTLTKSQGS